MGKHQNPLARSNVERKSDDGSPWPDARRSIASAVSGIGLSITCSLLLVSRKSTQNRMLPSFFVTSTTREPQAELDLRMMLRDSISSTC